MTRERENWRMAGSSTGRVISPCRSDARQLAKRPALRIGTERRRGKTKKARQRRAFCRSKETDQLRWKRRLSAAQPSVKCSSQLDLRRNPAIRAVEASLARH